MRRLSAVIFISVILCMIGPSNGLALDVTVGDNLTGNLYLTAGQTISGQFDINPAIPNDGNYNIPYDITNASTTFIFHDDYDTRYDGQSLVSSDVTYTGDLGASYNRYEYRTYYNYYYDDYEGVRLQVSSQISTDGTNWFQASPVYTNHYYNSVDNSHTHTYTYDCGTWYNPETCTGYIYHYVHYYYDYDYYDVDRGYTGELIMTSELSPSSIEDLRVDGVIDFSVTATSGDIIYNDGILKAELNPNPNLSPVPEPATLLLIGTGILCAAGYRRRKKI